MLSNLGLWVIKFPSGKYGFVGSMPLDLAEMVPATKSDVMGGRAIRNESGALVAPKFPAFADQAAAVEFARSKGYDAKVS